MTRAQIAENGAEGATTTNRKGLSPLTAQTIVLTNLALAGLACFALYHFGSIWAGLAFMAGDRLIPDAYCKSFGTADEGRDQTVSFALRNVGGNTITILGAKSTCTCVVADDLPVTIAPRTSHLLKVMVRPRGAGAFFERLRCFTDCSPQTELILGVKGRVVEERTQQGSPAERRPG